MMYGGGRRESRNAVPIEVKVAAISKIQSGRRPDTVSLDMDIPVGMINKWWLQREDIRTQFEKYCAAQDKDEKLFQQNVDKPCSSKDVEEEPAVDDKDEDFTPDEVTNKVDVDTDRRRPVKRKKKKEVELSPYKNRKRVELPTKEPLLPAKKLKLDEHSVASDHKSNSKSSNIQNKTDKISNSSQGQGKKVTPSSKHNTKGSKKTPKSKLREQVKKILKNSPSPLDKVKRDLVKTSTYEVKENGAPRPLVRISSPQPLHIVKEAPRRRSSASSSRSSTPKPAKTPLPEELDPSYSPPSTQNNSSMDSDVSLTNLVPFMHQTSTSKPSPSPTSNEGNIVLHHNGPGVSISLGQLPLHLPVKSFSPPHSAATQSTSSHQLNSFSSTSSSFNSNLESNYHLPPQPVSQSTPAVTNAVPSYPAVSNTAVSYSASHHPAGSAVTNYQVRDHAVSNYSFNSVPATAATAETPPTKAVNIKKELMTSGEYIEDNVDNVAATDNPLNRYYSHIGSEPTPLSGATSISTLSPAMIKQEMRASSPPPVAPAAVSAPPVPVPAPAASYGLSPAPAAPVNIKAEREQSVSPPASEYPLVPVSDNEASFDTLLQPQYPTPEPYGVQPVQVTPQPLVPVQHSPVPGRGRAAPVRGRGVMAPGRGQIVGRGQPLRGQSVRGQPVVRGQMVQGRGQILPRSGTRGHPIRMRGQPVQMRGQPNVGRGQPVNRGRLMTRGQPMLRGQPVMRGQPVARGQRGVVRSPVNGMRGGPVSRVSPTQPRRGGQLIRGAATVRRPPAPLPEKLANMNGLSIIRQKPVELPKNVRLPSGITLSHPRGIQNQPPSASSSSRPSSSSIVSRPQHQESEPPRKKVTMELSQKQIDALRSLGML